MGWNAVDVWAFSHKLSPCTSARTHTHTNTHPLSSGERYAKGDLLISWGLQDHLNTLSPLPFIILTSLLCCTFFVSDLTSYTSCINQPTVATNPV